MSLFYQHTINGDTKLAVWQIEEDESFFLARVPLRRQISHPHKRLQHLAGRYLLASMFPNFPYELIEIADTRKPFLSNEAYHFSISHCGDFAAAIVSKTNRVGVDIEQVKPIIQKIKRKFLDVGELELLMASSVHLPLKLTAISSEVEMEEMRNLYVLTLSWSAKEAIYKWFGEGGLDFKKHIQLRTSVHSSAENWLEAEYALNVDVPVKMNLRSLIMNDLVLTYVVT